MPPIQENRFSNPGSEPFAWKAGTRSVVSLLLFMHLCTIAVALTSTSPSPLQIRLLDVFRPYLAPLHLMVDYTSRFHFTHGPEEDLDHFLTVEWSEGAEGGQSFRLPTRKIPGSPRFHRLQLLANTAADFARSETWEVEIPRALASYYLNRWNQEEATVRVMAHVPLSTAEVARDTDPDGEDYLRPVYEAKATVFQGEVQLLKRSEALEVAPAQEDGP